MKILKILVCIVILFFASIFTATPGLQARDYRFNERNMIAEINIILKEMSNVDGSSPPGQNLKNAVENLENQILILGAHTDEHFIPPPDLEEIKSKCPEIQNKFDEQGYKLEKKENELQELRKKKDLAEKVYNKYRVKLLNKIITAELGAITYLLATPTGMTIAVLIEGTISEATKKTPDIKQFFNNKNQPLITQRVKNWGDQRYGAGSGWQEDKKKAEAIAIRFCHETKECAKEDKIFYEQKIQALTKALTKTEEQVKTTRKNLKEYLELCDRIRGFKGWKTQKPLPKIQVKKSASSTNVNQGDTVTYIYQVTNPGNVPLFPVNISDDKCFGLRLKTGDSNGNDHLEPREVWIYECSSVLTADSTNTVTVVGTDPDGTRVSDSAKVSVTVQAASSIAMGACPPPKVKVPNLIYMTEAQAMTVLKKKPLIGKVTQRQHSDIFSIDQVMAQTPHADACENPNSNVEMTISLGPKIERTPQPQPARLSAELDCGNSFELAPGDFAGRGCGIVVKGWRTNTDDRVQVKIRYNKSSGIEVVPGETSTPPSLMYTPGVSDSYNQYIFSESFRAKNNAPPGVTQVSIIVSQAGAGSVTLTLDIAVLRKGLQPSSGPGISPPVTVSSGSGGPYCVWRFKMFGDPAPCFNFAAAYCDHPRYTNPRNGYELVGTNMTWSEADAQVSQLSRYFQDTYGCLDNGFSDESNPENENPQIPVDDPIDDPIVDDGGDSDEPDDRCKDIEGSYAVVNIYTNAVECLCDPLVLNAERNRCIDCEPHRQAYMEAVVAKDFNRAQAIIATATNCPWSSQAMAQLNEFKGSGNEKKNSDRCRDLEARINSLANQVPSVSMDQVDVLYAQSNEWGCSLSPDTFRAITSASDRQLEATNRKYDKMEQDRRREDEREKQEFEKWMAEWEKNMRDHTNPVPEAQPHREREPISSDPSGGNDPGGMSCSECPKQNPGTKLNIVRPPNHQGNYVYCRYYENGQLAQQVPYINNKKEGWDIGYFSNGQLKCKTKHRNGCADGPYVIFQIKNGKYYKSREGMNKNCGRVKGSEKRYPAPK